YLASQVFARRYRLHRTANTRYARASELSSFFDLPHGVPSLKAAYCKARVPKFWYIFPGRWAVVKCATFTFFGTDYATLASSPWSEIRSCENANSRRPHRRSPPELHEGGSSLS